MGSVPNVVLSEVEGRSGTCPQRNPIGGVGFHPRFYKNQKKLNIDCPDKTLHLIGGSRDVVILLEYREPYLFDQEFF